MLPPFTGVFVFGDSLVDSGNALRAAQLVDDLPFLGLPNGAPTAAKGYFQGRFSDGYTFADLVANKLVALPTQHTFPYGFQDPLFGLTSPFTSRPAGNSLNFAYGGAQIRQGSEGVPDLDDQTDIYRNYPAADPNALYVVTMGGNDVRDLVPKSGAPVSAATAASRLASAAEELAEEVRQLFEFGARHILVTGIPDVGSIPYYRGAAGEAGLRALATQHSETLEALVDEHLGRLNLPAGAQLYRYSLMELAERVFGTPAPYGLTDLAQARTEVQAGALQPVGSGFLFFDGVHPSAQAHAIIAGGMLERLAGQSEAAPPPLQATPRVQAAIETAGGFDRFTATLAAGQTYVFDLLGLSSGAGSLADPKLRILDAAGNLLAEDDDAGVGLNARLSFTAPSSGDYMVEVRGVAVLTGSYALQGPTLRGSNVTVMGGAEDDVIAAGSGANVLRGGNGADSIAGGSGFDDTHGNMGNDTVRGGPGDDWVVGGKDDDVLFGDDGGDIVYGNLGADTCEGGAGDDVVRGGQQDDVLSGGDGADFPAGDRDADTITGGAGADIFHTHGEAGIDRVLDFNAAEGDRVNLLAGTSWTASQVGADTVVSMGGGGQMVLVGVQLSTLPAGWIFGA
jgi:phospholipase/lecithinase/hemolysin